MSELPSPLKCVIIDIDFFIQEKENEVEEPIIRIRGKTKENQLLIAHICGFYPYFFIDDIPNTTDAIQSLLYTEKEFGDWIKDHYPETKNKYYQHKPIYLHKILGRNPWRILRYSKKLKDIGIKSYENDISYVSRFLIDNNIKGLSWIEISNYKENIDKNNVRVVETSIENIKPVEDEVEFPLNILALSITINSITEEGKKIKNFSSVFEEKGNRIICASIAWGKNIEETKSKNFILEKNDDESERKLLFDLIRNIHAISPEVVVTFNGNQVTLPYLTARMERLGLNPATLGPYQD
ncbi:MAG: 3'-5' exonuclease, partial [Candidatus Heimdallarchaeaceae archaeon]